MCRAACRDVSHTPFFVEGKRLGRTSVQEILEELLQPDLRFRSAKLISAGDRERVRESERVREGETELASLPAILRLIRCAHNSL